MEFYEEPKPPDHIQYTPGYKKWYRGENEWDKYEQPQWKKPAASTSSIPHKPMNKPIAQSKGTSLNHNDKRFVEALTAKMEQLMDAKLNKFRQELQPVREQRKFPRNSKEQHMQSSAKTSTPPEPSPPLFEPLRKHTQAKSSNTLKEFEICYKCLSIDHCAKECPTKRKTNSAILEQKKSSASEHDSSTNDLNVFSSSLIHLSQPEGIDAGTATRGEHLDKDMAKPPKLLEPEGKLFVNKDQKQNYEVALEPQRYQTEVIPTRSTFEVQSHHQNEVKGVEELSYSQGEGLTVSVPTKKNQPDICQQMPKLQTRGNYLDSQKRMKPDLLSMSTGQKVLRTIRREYDDGKPCIHQGELSLLQPESTNQAHGVIFKANSVFKDDQPEPKFETLPHDYPKHCKETSSFNAKPSLLVLVSTQEEKRFGLEKVKEFCISRKVFDEIIPIFKTFEFETLFESNRFVCCDLDLSLKDPLNFKTFSKGPVFDNRFVNLAQFDLFPNKRKPLIDLCSKKDFCVNQCLNAMLSYDLNDTFTLDYTDIICLSLSREPNAGFQDLKRPRRAYKREEDKRFKPPDLDHPRRTYKREEDKRFKPPDLDQDKHQDINLSQHVKEAPPDLIYKPKPSLKRIGGKCLILPNSVSANLSFDHADGSDLRTNPFQEGGDDVILTSTKEMEYEPEIEPAPNWQLTKSTTSKREDEQHGAIQSDLLTPRTRELKGVHWMSAQDHGPTRRKAKPTCAHPCLICSAIGQVTQLHSFPIFGFCPLGFTKDGFLMRQWGYLPNIQLLNKPSPSPIPIHLSIFVTFIA